MENFTLAEFAKDSENKEDSSFTPQVQEAGIEQGSLIVSRLYNTMLGEITRTLISWNEELTKVLTEAGITPSSLSNEQLYTAINTLIQNANVSTKADVDLSNVTLSGKQATNYWISPDWGSAISVSASQLPYTVTEYGWIKGFLVGSSGGLGGNVYLNGVPVAYHYGSVYPEGWADGSTFFVKVVPGDVLSYTGSIDLQQCAFLPDKN